MRLDQQLLEQVGLCGSGYLGDIPNADQVSGNSYVDTPEWQSRQARGIETGGLFTNGCHTTIQGRTFPYVEFSVSAVPLLLFLFGTINFTLAVYAYNFTSYVAREATRYAAVPGSSSSTPAAATDVTNFVLAE